METSREWTDEGLLTGGRLCLDFANTADWHAREEPREWLNGYADLVGWSRLAGIVTPDEAQMLLRLAAAWPDEAQAVLERAVALREAIYRIILAAIAGETPQPGDLSLLNAAVGEAMCRLRLAPEGAGYAWRWPEEPALDRMLWPVARSTADLLTSTDLGRVRQCAGDPCGWLFLDESRNRSRRWCDMQSCGNRAKARRHYERSRSQRRQP